MSWWLKRCNGALDQALFSDTGFIIDGHAAIFLYKTNSAVCYLEMLIANPDVDADSAIDAVITAGLIEAQKLGFKVVLASSNKPQVIERVQRLGFHAEPAYTQVAYYLAKNG